MPRIHNSPYVMNSFLRQFPDVVMARGGDLKSLCADAGLAVEVVTGRDQLIPFDKFIALLEASEIALDYPEIALDLADKQRLEMIGPLSLMLSKCSTFAEALQRITRYLEVLVSGFHIEVKVFI